MIKYTEYKYHLAALFSVAVWGATFVSTKVLIANSLTPAEIFLLRFAMAYICIWPLSGRRLWASGWRDELTLSVAGITGGSLYFLTENMALEYAPASNVSLIVCTAPVWTAVLLSLLYRGERMTRRQAVGSALAFAGMVLVVLNGRFVLRLSPRGDMLALSAALLWMVYSLVIKRIGGRPAGIRFPAFFDHFRGVGPPRRVGQPAVPGDRSLDALLCPVERRDAQTGSRAHDQLHLFQPVGDDHHGGGLHRRAHHPRGTGRRGTDPLRHVAGGTGIGKKRCDPENRIAPLGIYRKALRLKCPEHFAYYFTSSNSTSSG